jgi:hypothetical protein
MIKKPFPYVNNTGNSSDGVLKDVADLYGKSLRVSDAHSVVDSRWDFVVPTYAGALPTRAKYYHGTEARRTTFTLGMADTLGGKYFKCYTAPDNHLFTFWFNLDGGSVQPSVPSTHTYVEIAVATGDVPQLVGLAIKLLLENIYSNYFYCLLDETSNANIEIITSQMGENTASDSGTTGFPISQVAGAQELVQDIEIAYNGTEPFFQGQELTGYIYDIYAGKFVLRDSSEAVLESIDTSLNNIEADADAIRIAVEAINTKIANNFGVAIGAIRTAAQIGNATGAADFNNGATGAQTLRTVANLAVTGADVSNANPVPTEQKRPASATVSSIIASTTNQTVVAANPNRKGLILFRSGTGTAYIKFGATATSTDYTVQLTNNTVYELPNPIYTGIIDVIFSGTAGTLKITEIF